MRIFDYIEEYDGEEVMNGKPMTYKMKKNKPSKVAFNDGSSKGKKPKGKRQSNPYKNMKQADI